MARSRVETPSHPHAPICRASACPVCLLLFYLFLFVCLSPLLARRTLASVSFWSPLRGGFKYTLRLQSTLYTHTHTIYYVAYIRSPLSHLFKLSKFDFSLSFTPPMNYLRRFVASILYIYVPSLCPSPLFKLYCSPSAFKPPFISSQNLPSPFCCLIRIYLFVSSFESAPS